MNLNKEEIFLFFVSQFILNNKSHGWSVAQHLYHCWLVECLTENYIRKKILNQNLLVVFPLLLMLDLFYFNFF